MEMEILWKREYFWGTNGNGKMEVGMAYYTCLKEVPFLHSNMQ